MENTARNFALQLGSLITLYISIGALISLLLGIITISYPDPAAFYEYDPAANSIRFGIALLVIFFPTYVVITRFVNNIRRTEQGTYLTLTKWLIYLSLLVGGGVLLGDLVATLYSFLNGDLTIRFVLKSLSVLLVTGSAFAYYFFDVRGHWQNNERHSVYYASVVSVAIIVSIVAGFMHIESPAAVRELSIDAKQLSDLSEIQGRIANYTVLHQSLPQSMEEAYEGLSVPTPPDGRTAYSYQVVDAKSFKLCADFNSDSKHGYQNYYGTIPSDPYTIKNPDDWDHGTGMWCFTRVLGSTK